MRIVVAMSGGVDSSVAAALLARQGHEVIGLSMQLYDAGSALDSGSSSAESGFEPGPGSDTARSLGPEPRRFGTCCTIDDLHDARRVAARIGIPHYIVNFEREFADTVISNFVSEYSAGRTPIPCVHCNGDLKFATLAARAEGLGADFVATGHYARVDLDPATGRYRLKRGADAAKDQSYFLFTLDQAQLSHAMFPVGDLDKTAVREQARELGLSVADKRDSHEICFVADGSHTSFLERHGTTASAGAIHDVSGHVVGRHEGVHRFTVGQRKGLGLASPIPLYVVGIDAAAKTVTVGPKDALERNELTASGVNWISGVEPEPGTRVTARIRHRHREAAASVHPLPGRRVRVTFDDPQSAVAPGQAVVMYDGDVVVGGGWID
ncbi:MAG: tRNA 2-thiouridine(34) synthase MnmA [Acidobacteriota bacterium]|jgi:tRNA-uridine 2-sulfurtransferase|nr:tRNA 2-thiouridine(34) synthase MnmA [Acidobacteriota bacterium]